MVADQNGKQATYAYDDADRVTSVTDAAHNVTQYAYDDENNLSSITDANSHATGFQYDQFGRVKETDFPSGTPRATRTTPSEKSANPQSTPRFPAAHALEVGKAVASPILRKT